ncbi:NAD(P)-dependent dehydrogenase (short-subunit alcohol dehydrogenase family) [Neorhizobium galegae]|uniref:SDR family NAD(P)-dependent oxidoreductase n=1 Tax=Neorhizobium galegae TaxID=399 RepID=UPI001AE62DDE|nr:SDR family oxidoreductase [Neorhizobium galegae]MBP2562187.1 NAD(P)-dependent dehydrogenase (short-subunit alcohol dehydrogenase family) [Neorhizobium galegae]
MSEFWVTAPHGPLPSRQKTRFFPVHEGKKFIVTGAAGGVGSALVALLVAEGATVAALDLREDALSATVAKYEGKVVGIGCDLGQQQSVETAFQQSTAQLGFIDGVVNNAALVRRGDAINASWDDWQSTMAVNVYGAFELARLAARSMAENGRRGAIVNVASEAGKKGHTQSITYGASKAALISMTRILAASFAPYDINVNCVCPGGIGTDMLRAAAANYARVSGGDVDDIFPRLVSSQLKRHITPDEVARTISFLLSDDALIIRGQAVNTDGGDTPY